MKFECSDGRVYIHSRLLKAPGRIEFKEVLHFQPFEPCPVQIQGRPAARGK